MSKRNLKINNKKNYFSYIFAWLAFCFSLYGCFVDYLSSSLIWVLTGFTLIFSFVTLKSGTKSFIKLFKVSRISNYANHVIVRLLALLFLFTSTRGMIQLILNIPIYDKSILFIPSIIFFICYSGSIINIFAIK